MGNMGVPPQEYPESLRNRLEFYGLRMVVRVRPSWPPYAFNTLHIDFVTQLLQSSADSLPSLLTNYDELVTLAIYHVRTAERSTHQPLNHTVLEVGGGG